MGKYMLKKDELPECPVATAVQLIGNKWKLLIIQRLLDRPYRFNELCRSIDGLSEKVLSENLKQLETDDIVVRTAYAEVPVRVEYALSKVGESMRPIIETLQEWGMEYKATH